MPLSHAVIRELKIELAACESRIEIIRQLLAQEHATAAVGRHHMTARLPPQPSARRRNSGLRRSLLEVIRTHPGMRWAAIAKLITQQGFRRSEKRTLRDVIYDDLRKLVKSGRVRRHHEGGYFLGIATAPSNPRKQGKSQAKRSRKVDKRSSQNDHLGEPTDSEVRGGKKSHQSSVA